LSKEICIDKTVALIHTKNFSNMPLQYLTDNEGNHTAVMIPISEWELLTKQFTELKRLEKPSSEIKERKPADFAGTMPQEVAEAFHQYLNESRDNW
jgi:hypothetical protein